MSQLSDARRTLYTILTAGTCIDLRTFLGSLEAHVREKLFINRFSSVRCFPLEMCIERYDLERTAILFEFGAPVDTYTTRDSEPESDDSDGWYTEPDGFEVDPNAVNNPLTSAIGAAALLRWLPILEAVIDEARRRGCLEALMAKTFPADIERTDRCTPPSLLRICKVDFAPAMALLLDSGLSHEHVIQAKWRGRYATTSPVRRVTARAAASLGATECLRLMHARFSGDEWQRVIDSHASGFCSNDANELLALSAIDPEALVNAPLHIDDTDRLDALLAQLYALEVLKIAPPGPDSLPAVSDADVAEMRARTAGWDMWTRLKMYDVLFKRQMSGLLTTIFMLSSGTRALAAALALGFPSTDVDWGAAAKMRPCYNQSACNWPAMLDMLAAAMPGGRPALWRQIEHSCVAIGDLVRDRSLVEAHAILEVGVDTHFGDHNYCCVSKDVLGQIPKGDDHFFRRDANLRLVTARLCIASLEKSHHPGDAVWTMSTVASALLGALHQCQPTLAQLYVDSGADLRKLTFSELIVQKPEGWNKKAPLMLIMPTSVLPACADAAVEASCHPAVVASFDAAAAHSHAAAAAAEEERMGAALLADPSCFDVCEQGVLRRRCHKDCALLTVPSWHDWRDSVASVLAVRWVWDRLGGDISSKDIDDAFVRAVRNFDARSARFLVAHGARFAANASNIQLQARDSSAPLSLYDWKTVCRSGHFELAWALLPALVGSGMTRGNVNEWLTCAISAGFWAVANGGHKFPRGLVSEFAAQGGRVKRRVLLKLCTQIGSVRIPGSFLDALRWVLETSRNRYRQYELASRA